ncbi:hypothetical protein EHQ58_10645 [Leptospira ognonensis]|uniref:Uncharacterized protein n=1 Tax=Leptospira ognonensis TaxID=2484945 RepID=A0A4R9JZN3_9LEPT|nr:hypothetical protein [Leptospira ognonensis]TGL57862.1 hypothetical protein EHQ58_10645 [Leptospira ognonensis]
MNKIMNFILLLVLSLVTTLSANDQAYKGACKKESESIHHIDQHICQRTFPKKSNSKKMLSSNKD